MFLIPFAYNKKSLGFTLLELLVVVAIIGLLSVLIIFNISQMRAKSRDTQRVSDIKSLEEALALYHNDFQRYPSTNGQVIEITGQDVLSTELLQEGVIQGIPLDPINGIQDGVTYKYYYQSDGKSYEIRYFLETDSVYSKSAGLNTATP